MQQVSEFAQQNDLSDIAPLLQKGALVAQNPAKFDEIDTLEEGEREALKDEVIHKWRQPRAMYFTVILCSIAAAVQGWDQTGSNGANLSWPVEFGVNDSVPLDGPPPPHLEYSQWIVGLVNAGPYIGSAFLGCWLSDPLNNFLGRRGTIFFSAIFCLLSVIGSGFTQTVRIDSHPSHSTPPR